MKIDRDLVLEIARLARIELKEDELDLFVPQLQEILQYIEKLNQVKQPSEPFSFQDVLPSALRPDTVVPSLPVEEALRNAPERVKRFFKVPRIIP
jgi:aspartyl-tRNA(Asn)/glutamyl-tRNA(Gln) amidotransferase subunit C